MKFFLVLLATEIEAIEGDLEIMTNLSVWSHVSITEMAFSAKTPLLEH